MTDTTCPEPDDFAAACAWADFREAYGVSANDRVREREHRAFVAGFEAARSNDDRGVQR